MTIPLAEHKSQSFLIILDFGMSQEKSLFFISKFYCLSSYFFFSLFPILAITLTVKKALKKLQYAATENTQQSSIIVLKL